MGEYGYAKTIADSIYRNGTRLTTIEAAIWRPVLAELNTHRDFSRNSASSRAIPIGKQLDRIRDNPARPLKWPAEQKGMQGGDELDLGHRYQASSTWDDAREAAIASAEELKRLGLHKSVTNRLLEPHMWHIVVITSTAWQNFFNQRCSPLAQPEIRHAAELMRDAMAKSRPKPLVEGEWHLPYISDDDEAWDWADDQQEVIGVQGAWERLAQISAARSARTSYLTQDGVRDLEKDLDLYKRLTEANPKHWSPLEHPATPWKENRQQGSLWVRRGESFREMGLSHLPKMGNLLGWRSLRTTEEIMMGEKTYV